MAGTASCANLPDAVPVLIRSRLPMPRAIPGIGGRDVNDVNIA